MDATNSHPGYFLPGGPPDETVGERCCEGEGDPPEFFDGEGELLGDVPGVLDG